MIKQLPNLLISTCFTFFIVTLAFLLVNSTDTTDWFEPTSNAPVLDVRHGGSQFDETYNPQPRTIDGSQLQQTAEVSEIRGGL